MGLDYDDVILPSLRKAKEAAKTLHCQANLKTMVLAVSSYSIENDTKFCGSWNYNKAGWGKPHDWAWAPWQIGADAAVVDYANATLEEKQEGVRKGVLFDYVEDVDAYHCVSDNSARGNFRSYSMPDCINGLWGQPTGTSNWDTLTKTSQISSPGNRYLFLEENDPRGYNINSWVIDPILGKETNMWADPLTVWHSRKSNLGFMDGHVETHKWSKTTEELFVGIDESGSWSGFWGRVPKPGSDEERDLQWLLSGWPE
jgi:prepilin-type processing-associated H-X9-DG protein